MTGEGVRAELTLRRTSNAAELLPLLADESIRKGALLEAHGEGGLGALVSDLHNVTLLAENSFLQGAESATTLQGAESATTLQGALVFQQIEPGAYEGHTMALQGARGRAYLQACKEAVRLMFLCSDAMELYTKVPQGNLAALGLTRLMRGRREFTFNSHGVSGWVYALRWSDWLWGPEGAELEASGRALMDLLGLQGDASAQRMFGAFSILTLNGVVVKSLVLFARWAALSGEQPFTVALQSPLVLAHGEQLLQVDFASRSFLPLRPVSKELH